MSGHRISQNHVLEAPQAEQALPPHDDIMDPPVFPREERSPQPIGDGVEDMDVEAGEVDAGPEPMTLDRFQEGEQGYDDDDQEGDTWLNECCHEVRALSLRRTLTKIFGMKILFVFTNNFLQLRLKLFSKFLNEPKIDHLHNKHKPLKPKPVAHIQFYIRVAFFKSRAR